MRSLLPAAVMETMLHTATHTPSGHFVEVGVYQGGSAVPLLAIAKAQGRQLHLFDTFTGMPGATSIDRHPIGHFSDTSVDIVRNLVPEALIYEGVFPFTLPPDLTEIAFVHCDVDQYDSTKAVIGQLWPRLVLGGVMWFDDCELAGASLAMDQFFHDMELKPGPEGRRYAVKS